LTPRRWVALGFLACILAAYFAYHESLPDVSTWWDVAIIGCLVIPAVFAPVWICLPFYDWRYRWLAIVVSAALAVAFSFAAWDGPASFAKLAAATFAGWLFLDFFEEASWVVIVSLIIPWVDAYSVWRGPTHTIVHHHAGVFTHLSFAFPVPGETGTANLGIPDMLFFALFLATTARFRLRTAATWVLMTASFGATIALAVWRDLDGLPALPLLSLAFLLANGDLLWREVRRSLRRNEQQNARRRPSRSPE
jgi:hypothetical protein